MVQIKDGRSKIIVRLLSELNFTALIDKGVITSNPQFRNHVIYRLNPSDGLSYYLADDYRELYKSLW